MDLRTLILLGIIVAIPGVRLGLRLNDYDARILAWWRRQRG